MDLPEPPEIESGTISQSPSAGKNSAAEQGTEIPMGWKPTRDEPVPVMRCTGTARTTGERCKKWGLRGTHPAKCVKHGGQLPSVRAHAEAVVESSRMRLYSMTDEAVDVIEDLLRPGTAEAIRLKAAELVLNKSGLKEAVEVSVEVNHNVSMAEEVTKKLEIMRERLRPDEPEEDDDTIDAEVVDSEEQN